MKKATISQKLAIKLSQMEVGDSFNKISYAVQIYGDYNFYIGRSLDVHFVMAKKLVPTMKFKSIAKKITRIK